ncbi:MAG: hypothetical protein JSU94_15465 [Phycisphaerales bacterium]|nr:MAG: hypothetical protein JSU94_15465 [Phycisphaerales bacterium]
MDGFDKSNLGRQDNDEPIPFGDDLDEPIRLEETGPTGASVSHSPLDLGGSATGKMPKIETPKPAVRKTSQPVVSTDRVTGVKTFFTKLHPGAMQFLDEQISNWLKENPGIAIKQTDTTTGEVQAKKTEPNIIITVWY